MYNWSRNSNGDFIFNCIRYDVSNNLMLMAVLSRFEYRMISGVIWCRLMEPYLYFFSINSWLYNFLLVVHIAWNTNILDSMSALVNRLSCYGIQIGNMVMFLFPVYIDFLLLLYSLNIGLGNIFISWYCVVQSLRVILNIRYSMNSW